MKKNILLFVTLLAMNFLLSAADFKASQAKITKTEAAKTIVKDVIKGLGVGLGSGIALNLLFPNFSGALIKGRVGASFYLGVNEKAVLVAPLVVALLYYGAYRAYKTINQYRLENNPKVRAKRIQAIKKELQKLHNAMELKQQELDKVQVA